MQVVALHNAVTQGTTVPWGTAWCIKFSPALIIGTSISSVLPGAIIVADSLDFEKSSNYFLTIEAMDMGTNPLKDSTTVNIHVMDANDNLPIFSQAFYSTNINEAARVNGDVIQVLYNCESLCYGRDNFSLEVH